MWEYRCQPVRVVDGDTVDLDLDLGFYLTARIRVRLAGVDTPEVRGAEREAGEAARAFVVGWFAAGDEFVVRTGKTGKYGRWLGDVWRDGGPVSLTEAIIDAGHDLQSQRMGL